MKHTKIILFTIFITVLIFSLNINNSISQVTDKDGNVYKAIIIGEQEWMAENLNVEHYRNGDVITQVQDEDEWSKLTTGAWCYYDNDPENGNMYGKLYNWYAVNDSRGLAPEGWHIPSDAEWKRLTDYLGGVKEAVRKLKSTTVWINSNTEATNESGFNAFPGGNRDYSGKFDFIGESCLFWSSTEEYYYNLVWYLYMDKGDSGVSRLIKELLVSGLSVRCVRD